MAIIGIDLGTTNSLTSIWKDGQAQIIPNVLGKHSTPSIVSVDENNEILIGGSTRMPLVRSVVSKMFNKLPYSNINPDETVALGAAIQADLKELVLTDLYV